MPRPKIDRDLVAPVSQYDIEKELESFLDYYEQQVGETDNLVNLFEFIQPELKNKYFQLLVNELGEKFLPKLKKSLPEIFEKATFNNSYTVSNALVNTTVTNPQFQIIGNKIYDPNGKEFISKGANMFAWEGIANVNNYLNTWGFNTIRVPNYLLGSYGQLHPSVNGYGTNHQIVDAFTSSGAVVIFDAHDRIGSYYEGQDWETLKNYWRDMAQQFKDNSYVWFDLHNEPGNGTANLQKWVNYHRELIDIIRAEGANNLIVVEGETWGQDYLTQTIPNHASEVMTGNNNILFSIHAYDRWNGQNIGAYFDSVQSQNIPIIVGEYGSVNVGQSTLDASNRMMTAAQQREIGRIVWNAKADNLRQISNFTTLNNNVEIDTSIRGNNTGDELVISGNNKNNLLSGDKTNDWIKGKKGKDKLFGNKGDDLLSGQDNNDSLFGNEGDDVLIGGKDDDTLSGGKGRDLFVLSQNKGIDTIIDFERGQDLIQLADNLAFEDLIITAKTGIGGNNIFIGSSKNDELIAVITNANFESLTVVDFID
jgi:mannan endo-1,4-beta-mannosidase